MALSGERVVATQTRHNFSGTTGSSTSTSYVSALSAGPKVGIDFVAPPSGIVTVHFAVAGFNSGANDNKTAVQVAAGAVVDSGTLFYGATDNDMILYTGSATYRIAGFAHIPGLTPGNAYNAVLMHRVSAGTGSWLFRRIKVIPDV